MDINALYNEWLDKAVADPDIKAELESVKGNEDEILDRFYRELEFGTAGLRGVIGAGTNRMNYYTVGRATQGLSDFLNRHFDKPSIAIGYDSRIKSTYFSVEAAKVLAANGIKVYLYEELEPTPCLSYAIRYFKTSSGIILTASHNPAKYNGYKCYNSNGYQMTDDEADETYEFIKKVDYFGGIKSMDFDEAVAKGLIEYIGDDVIDSFLDEVEKQCVNRGVCEKADIKVIYTPLNGTGNKPVRKILDRIGVKKVYVVPEQENPDGNFPTCPFPNPEIKQAFECALKMADSIRPDILLATDPDCDRVGIAVNDGGDYKLMSGNEVGAMMLNYLLSQKKAQGTLAESAVAVKSFVSTDLAEVIAKKYNCTFKNLLTGFKYIGELITELEAQGRANDFVMGFEESYGYLAGTHARDKDAVVASMLICEMAAYYKTQGKTLVDVMNGLYDEFGYYFNTVSSYTFEGASGMEKMAGIMDGLRANAPAEFAGFKVTKIDDYKASTSTQVETGKTEPITLPKSNVLAYTLTDGNKLIVRPSGTEPKIKAYVTAIAKDREEAQKIADRLLKAADGIME
jgi:phosphoglucomutase